MVQCFQGGSKSCPDKNLPLELPFMARENNLRIQRVAQPLLLPVPQTIWSLGRHASGFCRRLATEGKMLKLGRCSLMCLRRGPKGTRDTKQICVWSSPYFTPSHVLTTYPPERASRAPGLQGLGGCNSSCWGMLPAVLHSLLAISTRTLQVTHTQISQFSSDDVSHHLPARTNCQEPEFVILSCHLKSCSRVATEPEPFVRNARMLYVQIHSLWWASTATKQYLEIVMPYSICLCQSLRPHWDLSQSPLSQSSE